MSIWTNKQLFWNESLWSSKRSYGQQYWLYYTTLSKISYSNISSLTIMNRKTWNFWKKSISILCSQWFWIPSFLWNSRWEKKLLCYTSWSCWKIFHSVSGLDWNRILNCKDKDLPNFLFTNGKIWFRKTNLRIIGKIEQNGSTMKTMKEI